MQLPSIGVKFMVAKEKLHFDAPLAHRLNCLAMSFKHKTGLYQSGLGAH